MRKHNRFRDKTIDIYTTEIGYRDKGGIYHEGKPVIVDTYDCNVQPYSSELLYETYGYKKRVTNVTFLDLDPRIKAGMIAKNGTKEYEIKLIIKWGSYMELFLDDGKVSNE